MPTVNKCSDLLMPQCGYPLLLQAVFLGPHLFQLRLALPQLPLPRPTSP